MTPTHIPPAMRGEGVPEWIVEVPCVVGKRHVWPKFVFVGGEWTTHPYEGDPFNDDDVRARRKYARAATPTEITAARDGGRGDA